MFWEIVSLLLGLITICWVLIKRKYNYWNSRGIDSVPAVFPYGSLKECFLLKRNLGETFADFYRQYNGKKYVGFYGPFEAMLLIRDPELIRTVLVKEFNSFADSGFTVRKDIDPLLAYNPFGTTGLERWKTSRSITTPALTTSKIKIMLIDMVKSAENFTNYIATKTGEPLEMKLLGRYFLMDGVLAAGFGIESNSFLDKNNTFREFTHGEMFADNSEANYASLSGMFMPLACRIFRWRTLSKKVEKVILDMNKSCVEHRKRNGITRPDLLQHLMNLNKKADQENRKPFSDIEMAAHSISLYGDGVDTVSMALSAAFHYLAKDNEVQEKLRAEIKNSIQDLNELDYDKMHSLEYLDMVVTEILRLHPPVPLLSRTCTRTINLDDLKVYAGTKVFIPTYGLHMDPEYYPEPEKFQPERFSKEKRADLHKFVFLPFGEGPRMCVGFRFGQVELKVALIAVLSKFRMNLADETKKAEKDGASSFVLSLKGDIDVIFTKI